MSPRVKTLVYKVISGESVDYEKASVTIEKTDCFTLRLSSKWAYFEFEQEISTTKEARNIVDEFLTCWEVYIGLEHDPGDLRFDFDHAEYEAVEESSSTHTLIAESGTVKIVMSDQAQLHVSRIRFPSRPHRFKLSPDVITMYDRYKLYRQGKESITSMAYMCLTILEASARATDSYCKTRNLRGKASHQYNIEYEVLDRLAMLVSTKGDQSEARKAPKDGIFKPLNHEDREWVVRAIKVLIRRTGEYAYAPGDSLRKITMCDL